MESSKLPKEKEILKQRKKHRLWLRVITAAAAVVVFVTTYMLILPAITMERKTICGKEEHIHSEECYENKKPEKLLCENSLSPVHVHTESCYGENGEIICGYADFILHTHDASCYDGEGNLICPLPENSGHRHTDACFAEESRLICGMEETANEPQEPPAGGEVEIPGFTDGETEGGEPEEPEDLFGSEPSAEEPQEPEVQETLAGAAFDTGHRHTDACYETKRTLTCGKAESWEPHVHEQKCYLAEDRSLSEWPLCGKLEVYEHIHSAECIPAETRVPVCGLEEHTHTEACYPAPTEEPEEPEPTVTPIVAPEEPEPTVTPTVTPEEPEPTVTPIVTPTVTPEEPEPTVTPTEIPEEPEPTVTPIVTPEEPEPTVTPTVTPEEPEPTITPIVTPEEPEPTVTPTVTPEEPEPTITPIVTPEEPEPTVTPTVTPEEPEPTVVPTVTPEEPEPTVTPIVTPEEPEPTVTPTETPEEPEPTVEPTVTPEEPEPTVTPTVTPEEPEPTVVPIVTPEEPEPTVTPIVTPEEPEPTVTPTETPEEPEPSITPPVNEPTLPEEPGIPGELPGDGEGEESGEAPGIEIKPPLNVEQYVDANDNDSGARLSYRIKGTNDWILITGAENEKVPGEAEVKLEVRFADVHIDDLLAADGKMQYQIPSLLKNPHVTGNLVADSKPVGTIKVENGIALLDFNNEWLEQQKDESTEAISTINGSFYVESEFNLGEITDGTPGFIKIGDVTININFDDEVTAKAADVIIAKTVGTRVISEESGDYLEYTLTASVPADAAAAPDVSVVDRFTATTWIDGYVGVTGTETAISGNNVAEAPMETGVPEGGSHGTVYIGGGTSQGQPIPAPGGENVVMPGMLVWKIGDMQPGESRTLTYRVKLKKGYTGGPKKDSLTNSAEIFSKQYFRDDMAVTFTPAASMTMSKVAGAFVPDEQGGGNINYTVWVNAPIGNTYTLNNVKIFDSLENTNNATAANVLPYLNYNKDSFKLYQGGVNKQNGSAGLTEITPLPLNPNTEKDNPDISEIKKEFNFYVGNMNPGESKTLTYTVKVEPGIFTLGNDALKVNNRALLFSDDTRDDTSQFNAYNQNKEIDRKTWDRKLAGEPLTEDRTIAITPGDVYSEPGKLVESPPENFTVPAGSYEYKIVVNEDGDWDLSGTTLGDSLGEYLKFTGYMKVQAYQTNKGVLARATDEQAVSNLEAMTPVKTVWLEIDKDGKFSFEPEELGLSGKLAYLLTYYAEPQDLGENTSVVVANDFSVSGNVVGPDGKNYELTGVHVSKSVTVQKTSDFHAEKFSWYYDRTKASSGDWSKGAIYWGILMEGSEIPKGIGLKDIPGNDNIIHQDSLVGIYKGKLPEGKDSINFENYNNFSKLEEIIGTGKELQVLDSNIYECTVSGNSLTLKFKERVLLNEGVRVYAILKTEPTQIPQGKRDTKEYQNQLKSSGDNGTTWSDENTAQFTVTGSDNVFKESVGVFSKKDGTYTSIYATNRFGVDKLVQDSITENGTYLEWRIHINYDGTVQGTAEVTELLPKGLTPVYVRYFWMGADYSLITPKPTVPRLSELADNGWEEMELSYVGAGTTGPILDCYAYYNPSTNEIRWNVNDLKSGGAKPDARAVEFQIVCKLTDEKLLQGGGTKEYNNSVSVKDETGRICSDQAPLSVTKTSLAKQGTYDKDVNGGTYPFEIKVNEFGEDLMPQEGVDTITLVDELSPTLILDVDSIRVKITGTAEEVEKTVSVVPTANGQTLKLVIPDNKPLTITYDTTIDAAPGAKVDISNSAHWEGYASPTGGSVSIPNFSYTAGGTISTEKSPGFKVKKLAQEDSHSLEGAEFTLTKVEMVSNSDGKITFNPAAGKTSITRTTNVDGIADFTKDDDDTAWMDFNTIYCLTEKTAPNGYVLDSKPYYFAIAREVENADGSGKKGYPKELQTWAEAGVYIYYSKAQYTYTAYNQKGRAAVEKQFLNSAGAAVSTGSEPAGSYRFGIYESLQNGSSSVKPMQVVTIIYQSGKEVSYQRDGVTVDRPEFINLELNTTYYIYELDDSGRPIMDGEAASSGGRTFTVTYGERFSDGTGGSSNANAVKLTDNTGSTATVVVKNREKKFSLPATGGRGPKWYLLGGLLLLGAVDVLLYRKRAIKKARQITNRERMKVL